VAGSGRRLINKRDRQREVVKDSGTSRQVAGSKGENLGEPWPQRGQYLELPDLGKRVALQGQVPFGTVKTRGGTNGEGGSKEYGILED